MTANNEPSRSRRFDQRDLPCQGGLAATGFAHHGQGLPRLKRETDAVQRAQKLSLPQQSPPHRVIARQVLGLDDAAQLCASFAPRG